MNKIVFYFPYDKSYQDLVNETFEKATGKSFNEATEEERFDSSTQTSEQFLAEIDKLDFLSKTNVFQHLMNEHFNLSEPTGSKIENFLANSVFTESRELMTSSVITNDTEIETWITEFEKG